MEVENIVEFTKTSALSVAIAIKGNKKSKCIVLWALEKFIPKGITVFKLLHVRPRIAAVPTPTSLAIGHPVGNFIPIEQVRDDVAAAYEQEVKWKTDRLLHPYIKLCTKRRVEVEVKVIESDDVAKAIAEEVASCNFNKLVIGAATRGIFTGRVLKNNMSSRISLCVPSFCTVYAVEKGKLSSISPSDLDSIGSTKDDSSESSRSSSSSSSQTSSSQTDLASVASYSNFSSPSLPVQRLQALSTINKSYLHSKTISIDTIQSRCRSLDVEMQKDAVSSCFSGSEVGRSVSQYSSYRSQTENHNWSDQDSISDAVTEDSSSEHFHFELEKLRNELRHVQGMYAIAQKEKNDASQKLDDLSKYKLEEEAKLSKIKLLEEEARESARQEEEKCEAARMEAESAKACAEREAGQRQDAEMRAKRELKEKEKLERALDGELHQYRNLTWEEIESATSSFLDDLRIGMGAYGTVYKGTFHHTVAAVKVLRNKGNHQNKQFLQELEVLSKIHHPHLLLLLGACPDRGCLVYEYMENGSLEDRLNQKNNTPPIPWFERYRIAWEVASALAFLHNSKPKPIIHRDLKPGNILLDHNLVSKIGDVGLSTMLTSDPTCASAMYNDTGPVGTLCYIDPEYQRTGLISPKSDVYAFGMVILQLLTAKPAIALTHLVETAIDEDNVAEILDSRAGDWPIEETKQLAALGLSCAELRRKDRPDLKDQVLPVLERLKEIADKARETIRRVNPKPPNHFLCPILKEVMKDPCVAADGYTYEHKAIEEWLKGNDNSPMTNLLLPNKNILPNYTLLSAITEWKSK